MPRRVFRWMVMASLCAFGAAQACGSDYKNPTVADAGTTDATAAAETAATSDGAVTSDASSSDAAVTGDALSATCGTGDICFDVESINAGTTPLAGRVIVMWAQLDDDGPDPVFEVGFDAPFAGTETRVAIPIAQITPPTEQNLLCERTCDDEATCPCQSDPKVGTGYVLVVVDQNQNGKIDPAADTDDMEPIVGVGRVLMGYSASAVKPAPATPPFWRQAFPDGIEQGVAPYSLVRPEAGPFDRFGGAPAGTVFKLMVCDTENEAECDLPFPNPT